MTGRSTTFADEGSGVFSSLGNLAMDLRASITHGRFTPFTGLAPSLPLLVAGNQSIAQRLYRGVFAFAGHTIECQPPQIFTALQPCTGWADELQGFSWLAHLEATGLHLYRAFARSLLQNWAAQRRQRSSFEASCRRLISLSRYAGFMLSDASTEFDLELRCPAQGLGHRDVARAGPAHQGVGFHFFKAIRAVHGGNIAEGGGRGEQRTLQLSPL